ncbi:hypothetical protein BV898_13158 [Hypsibius exemplaris]|uniref:Chitin-binding type-2 domain-containing protein n=1 Tax=Hypsibius exemplaris TaxID=2072580 RepID=A0A1W0WBQ5_HYPEX|nr:hypothetical protein BV898_13158 [Hypsibius exemplaris]
MQAALIVLAAVIGVALAGDKNGDQNPKIWDALKKLRGKDALTAEQIQDLYPNAVPGKDFPNNLAIPQPRPIDCAAVKPGFHVDDSSASDCQLFDRCDVNGNLTSYICPALTRFNQITLICDYFFNVDCAQSKQFADYSNGRLYAGETSIFLDDQNDAPASSSGEAAAAAPAPKKGGKKKSKRSKVVA